MFLLPCLVAIVWLGQPHSCICRSGLGGVWPPSGACQKPYQSHGCVGDYIMVHGGDTDTVLQVNLSTSNNSYCAYCSWYTCYVSRHLVHRLLHQKTLTRNPLHRKPLHQKPCTPEAIRTKELLRQATSTPGM